MSQHKKTLLLTFDAFNTLFTPRTPIPLTYLRAAQRHGLQCNNDTTAVAQNFKAAFHQASTHFPNYGKASHLGASQWWGNVIRDTFAPFVPAHQAVPHALVRDLLHVYSSKEGYTLYGDVVPLFEFLQSRRRQQQGGRESSQGGQYHDWRYRSVVVGIVTNSDARVPSILSSLGLVVGPLRYGDAGPCAQQPSPDQKSSENDIDFVVTSYDVGFEKPDRRIFEAAREVVGKMLGVEVTLDEFECVHVGDDVAKDVHGAKGAGWKGVRLVREVGEEKIGSVDEITGLDMLPEILSDYSTDSDERA